MDPLETLKLALRGDDNARQEFNFWVSGGGYPVTVKAFIDSAVPQMFEVDYIGPTLVRGNCGLVFRDRKYIKYDKVVL